MLQSLSSPSDQYDPDLYRMTLGDHLEELRKRIILGLVGVVIAFVICAAFGEQVIQLFCAPLVHVFREQRINPQLHYTSAGDPFTVYLKITMISAFVISSPWMVWQLWLFVAAGLYPKERRAISHYAPLSILLVVLGVVFCFLVVLPLSLRFFIAFGGNIPLSHYGPEMPAPTTLPSVFTIPAQAGDPATPLPYQMWFDTQDQRLKFAVPNAEGAIQTMVVQFGPQSLVAPMITLPEYIDMVLRWLLVFAVAFQLPLVTMAIAKIGLLDVQSLRNFRKYVYVILAVVSAMLMPDVFSGTLMLLVPLCLLYELGIFLASRNANSAGDQSRGFDVTQ